MKNLKSYISLVAGLFISLITANLKAQELDEYLLFAAQNNPEINAAYTGFEASLQKAPQVASLPDPTLTVSAFGQMMETRLGAQEARFNLMQMFPWFGKLEAEKTTAELMTEAKFQQYLAVREKLFLQVKLAYAEIYRINEVIEIQKENLDILDSYRKLALNRFEAGKAPMVNVVKVDIKREEAATEIELMERELESLKKQFNFLLNREADAAIAVQEELNIDALDLDRMTVEDTSFESHPEVEMLEREKEAFKSEQLVAKKMGMPMIGLGIDYTVISKRNDAKPMDNGQDAIMPMLSISLPIFRKKYNAAIKEAELMTEATEHQRQARVNDMKSDFEMASFQLKRSKRLLELYDKQIESSGQANKLLISGFSNANSDFEEVLQMNQDVLMFQTEKISAVANAYQAAAKLQFLLFKNTTDENK